MLFFVKLYLLFILNIWSDRWPQVAISYNSLADSMSHKQPIHPFDVHIPQKVNVNGSMWMKSWEILPTNCSSPKHSFLPVYFQLDICNQSYFIPYILNEINYNHLKQLGIKVRYRKVYLQCSHLKISPWLFFPHTYSYFNSFVRN